MTRLSKWWEVDGGMIGGTGDIPCLKMSTKLLRTLKQVGSRKKDFSVKGLDLSSTDGVIHTIISFRKTTSSRRHPSVSLLEGSDGSFMVCCAHGSITISLRVAHITKSGFMDSRIVGGGTSVYYRDTCMIARRRTTFRLCLGGKLLLMLQRLIKYKSNTCKTASAKSSLRWSPYFRGLHYSMARRLIATARKDLTLLDHAEARVSAARLNARERAVSHTCVHPPSCQRRSGAQFLLHRICHESTPRQLLLRAGSL